MRIQDGLVPELVELQPSFLNQRFLSSRLLKLNLLPRAR